MVTAHRILASRHFASAVCAFAVATSQAWASDAPPVVKQSPISTDGSDPKSWDMKLVSTVAAPGNHKIIFEDDYVRVLAVNLPAGTEEPYHLHPYYSVLIMESLGQSINRDATGNEIKQNVRLDRITTPVGVSVAPPEALHSVKSIDKSVPNRLIRVEFKTGIIPTLIHPDWPNGKIPISDDGTDPKTWDAKLDSVIAVPDVHQMIFEDDSIRILTEVLPAGIAKPQHTHPYSSVLVGYGELPLSGATTDAYGKVTSYSVPGTTGIYADVRLAEPAASHSNKITGPHSVHVIRIEFKNGFPAQ